MAVLWSWDGERLTERELAAGLHIVVNSGLATGLAPGDAPGREHELARIGHFLGYHVTVCDARPVFATRKRFPEADDLVVQWPHKYLASTQVDERTVLCVLTHDPKFDVPLLRVALRLPEVDYIGVMGSRRTHDDRMKRLREIGLTDAEVGRLASPIGLDLGARTPEETAVSIAAEIIARRWGGGGRPLAVSDHAGDQHGPAADAEAQGDHREQMEQADREVTGERHEEPAGDREQAKRRQDFHVFAAGRRLGRQPFEMDGALFGSALGGHDVEVDRTAEAN